MLRGRSVNDKEPLPGSETFRPEPGCSSLCVCVCVCFIHQRQCNVSVEAQNLSIAPSAEIRCAVKHVQSVCRVML